MEFGQCSSEYRVVVLGATSVGKTSIINSLTADSFDPKESTTVAASFVRHEVTVGDTTVVMQIWDTAGQEKYKSLSRIYYRGSRAAVAVFDLTQLATFEALDDWIHGFTELVGDDAAIFVLGNKADLTDKVKVTERVIQKWLSAQKESVKYFRTSAVDGSGIALAFKSIAEELHRRQSRPAAPSSEEMSLVTDDVEGKRCC
jgi:small GTP-binding protein